MRDLQETRLIIDELHQIESQIRDFSTKKDLRANERYLMEALIT